MSLEDEKMYRDAIDENHRREIQKWLEDYAYYEKYDPSIKKMERAAGKLVDKIKGGKYGERKRYHS